MQKIQSRHLYHLNTPELCQVLCQELLLMAAVVKNWPCRGSCCESFSLLSLTGAELGQSSTSILLKPCLSQKHGWLHDSLVCLTCLYGGQLELVQKGSTLEYWTFSAILKEKTVNT